MNREYNIKNEITFQDILPTFNNIVQKLENNNYENWVELLERFIKLYNKILESDNRILFAPILNDFKNIINKYYENKNELHNSHKLFEEFKIKILRIKKPLCEMLHQRLVENGLR